LAAGKHEAEHDLGFRLTALGGLLCEAKSLFLVLDDAAAGQVQRCQHGQPQRIALVGGFAGPVGGFVVILVDAAALRVGGA
jgi:hypothetical protein